MNYAHLGFSLIEQRLVFFFFLLLFVSLRLLLSCGFKFWVSVLSSVYLSRLSSLFRFVASSACERGASIRFLFVSIQRWEKRWPSHWTRSLPFLALLLYFKPFFSPPILTPRCPSRGQIFEGPLAPRLERREKLAALFIFDFSFAAASNAITVRRVYFETLLAVTQRGHKHLQFWLRFHSSRLFRGQSMILMRSQSRCLIAQSSSYARHFDAPECYIKASKVLNYLLRTNRNSLTVFLAENLFRAAYFEARYDLFSPQFHALFSSSMGALNYPPLPFSGVKYF